MQLMILILYVNTKSANQGGHGYVRSGNDVKASPYGQYQRPSHKLTNRELIWRVIWR